MSVALAQKAQRYAFSHYGNLILIDEPIFDEQRKIYVSNLKHCSQSAGTKNTLFCGLHPFSTLP